MTLIIGRSLVVERDHLIDGRVRFGSHLAVQAATTERPQSGVKLKQQDQKLTLGLEGRPIAGKRPYFGATRNSLSHLQTFSI